MRSSGYGEEIPELRALLGLRAWGVSIGVGSFLTVNFGKSLRDSTGSTRGEYLLWLYGADWSLSRKGAGLANSEQDRRDMQHGVAELEGALVVAATYDAATLTLLLTFEKDLRLSVTPTDEPDEEQWMLYVPAGDVVTVGSSGRIIRERGAGEE